MYLKSFQVRDLKEMMLLNGTSSCVLGIVNRSQAVFAICINFICILCKWEIVGNDLCSEHLNWFKYSMVEHRAFSSTILNWLSILCSSTWMCLEHLNVKYSMLEHMVVLGTLKWLSIPCSSTESYSSTDSESVLGVLSTQYARDTVQCARST